LPSGCGSASDTPIVTFIYPLPTDTGTVTTTTIIITATNHRARPLAGTSTSIRTSCGSMSIRTGPTFTTDIATELASDVPK